MASSSQRPEVILPVPGSKSVTHRAFLLGALSSVPCTVEAPLMGADCKSTLSVLKGLGARFEVLDGAVRFDPIDDFVASGATLDCGNSGTTLRLMAGQAARLAGPTTLTGDDSLRGRPNGPLLDALARAGASVASEDGTAPLTLEGPISAGERVLPPRVSSQYASSLMLAAALLEGDSVVILPAPVASRPYLDITREVAAAFGVELAFAEDAGGLRAAIAGGQRPKASRYAVEGDWSGAAFPLVAGAVLGRRVALTGLRRDSAQGDRAVVDVIGRFGPRIAWRDGMLALEPMPLKAPGVIDLEATPDMFPALVALAAMAEGTTTFVGAPSLRHKECDRIAAMAAGLGDFGVECSERPDGLVVVGGGIRSSRNIVWCHHDHRIHMAFSILGKVAPAFVSDLGCEAVSYPDFHAHLRAIAGQGGGEAAGAARK